MLGSTGCRRSYYGHCRCGHEQLFVSFLVDTAMQYSQVALPADWSIGTKFKKFRRRGLIDRADSGGVSVYSKWGIFEKMEEWGTMLVIYKIFKESS